MVTGREGGRLGEQGGGGGEAGFRGTREKLLWRVRWRRKAAGVENGE